MKEKSKVRYFKQSKFYSDFHCIGDKCLVNCCFDWGTIGWNELEYKKLIEVPMTQELKEKIEGAFVPTTSQVQKKIYPYQIKYNSDGKCPMLTKEGWCSIQRELGEEYLSHTCRVYPRIAMSRNSVQSTRSCHSSCTYVMQILCNDENAMELVDTADYNPGETDHAINISEKDLKKYPQTKYTGELFDFFYEILSNKSYSIETSMTLSAIAAKKLDEFIAKGQADKLPQIINALKPQLNNPVQIEKLENVKPNLSLKVNFAAEVLKEGRTFTDFAETVFENGVPNEEKWQKGTDEFIKKHKPFALRNIALNTYITGTMPFHDLSFSLYDNFRFYAAEYAIIKYLAVTSSLNFKDNPNGFEVTAAYIDRGFSHSLSSIKLVLGVMDKYNIISPAYLMGILR